MPAGRAARSERTPHALRACLCPRWRRFCTPTSLNQVSFTNPAHVQIVSTSEGEAGGAPRLRSRCFINSSPVTLKALRAVGTGAHIAMG